MNSKLIISFIVLSIALAACAIECPADICSRVICANENEASCSAKKMIFREKGGFCGCCNVCLTKLNKGDDCALTMIRGLPAHSACDTGLVCDTTTKVCLEK